jgi:hypothetical protein
MAAILLFCMKVMEAGIFLGPCCMTTAIAVYVIVTSAIFRGMKGDESDLVQFHLGEGQAIPHGIPPGKHINDA